ncbi:MAG: hypothetical protein ACHQFX_19225 [Chitinophagales bacterium]
MEKLHLKARQRDRAEATGAVERESRYWILDNGIVDIEILGYWDIGSVRFCREDGKAVRKTQLPAHSSRLNDLPAISNPDITRFFIFVQVRNI